MQNIPYVDTETYTQLTPANMADRIPEKAKTDLFEDFFSQQITYAQPTADDAEEALCNDLFEQRDTFVEKELATAPVSTDEQMIEAAPETENAAPVEEKEVLKPAESCISEHPADTQMTREDFEEVRDDLEEYGLSEEEIQELEDKVDSEEGLTWGEFVETLNEKITQSKKVELSPEQTEQLQSLFAKLGFNDSQSKKLINDLSNGDSKKVLDTIMKKLDSLPQDSKILLDKGEVEAFAAAVNSSKEFTAEIKKMFSKAALPKDMKEAFSFINQEMTKLDQKEVRLVRAIGETLVKTMGKELKASTATAETNRPVDLGERTSKSDKSEGKEKSKADHTAREHVQTDHAAEKSDKHSDKHTIKQVTAESKGETGQVEIKHTSAKGQENSTHKNDQDDKNTLAQHKQHSESGANTKQDDSGQPFAEKDGKQNSAWNQFFSKLSKTERASAHHSFSKIEDLAKAIKHGGKENAKTAIADLTASTHNTRAWEKISAPKVMKQVNTALFSNLGQGKKQLTLHLKPEALGAVKVILQVQGKEVNASLRAESADAAKVIADNLDAIKQNLENQGLKVNKLEVQTGLADNSNQNWQGEMQHNQARDRDQMARMRQRMRNLRGESGLLARDMQNMTDTANVAEKGLHVIA